MKPELIERLNDIREQYREAYPSNDSLAEALGISATNLNEILNNKRSKPNETYFLLCRLWNLDPATCLPVKSDDPESIAMKVANAVRIGVIPRADELIINILERKYDRAAETLKFIQIARP